jgi:hypothetical protein
MASRACASTSATWACRRRIARAGGRRGCADGGGCQGEQRGLGEVVCKVGQSDYLVFLLTHKRTMKNLVEIFTNNGHTVLINPNSIAIVWAQVGTGQSIIKLNTFIGPTAHDEIYTAESIAGINLKVKQALSAD